MAFREIPVTNSPNKTLVISLPINGGIKKFLLEVKYNEVAEYWLITVRDANTKEVLLSNIPLVTGGNLFEEGNLLQQFGYLRLGSLIVHKTTETELDYPDDTSLGNNFVLVWGDNI